MAIKMMLVVVVVIVVKKALFSIIHSTFEVVDLPMCKHRVELSLEQH